MDPLAAATKLAVTQPESQQSGFLKLLEGIGVPTLVHRGGRLLHVNAALEVLTGISRTELLAMAYYEIAHPDSREMIRQRGEARVRGEAVSSRYEYQVATKSGEVRWVEASIALVEIDGLPTVIASLTDLTERKNAYAKQDYMQQVLGQIIEGNPVPTLVIDADHRVTHWNRACAEITGFPASELLGTNRQWRAFYPTERPTMADLVVSGAAEAELDGFYHGRFKRSEVAVGAYEAEDFFSAYGEDGRWLFFTAAPLRDAAGRIVGAIETLQDVTERRLAEQALRDAQTGLEALVESRTRQLAMSNEKLADDIAQREAAEQELRKRYVELSVLNAELLDTRQQLAQSEKLASIGQLAAGMAHEINNPIGYVHSNIGALGKYLDDVFEMLSSYEAAEALIGNTEAAAKIRALHKSLDIDFLREDIPQLIKESKEGISRVKKIVQDLKDFSHVDSADKFQWANLHQGIDSTLNIVASEIKDKAEIVKEYGELPEVECLPTQINQVIMSLCVNAAHAIPEGPRGRITIRSGCAGENVWIEIVDTGGGIPVDILSKIFDPFFTTKPVGKNAGLGLSLSYGIIKNHNGRLAVKSEVGKGTTFRITLPVKHTEARDEIAAEPVPEDWVL